MTSRGKDTAFELAQEWLEREVTPEFFEQAGKHSPTSQKRLFDEIPLYYKHLAYVIITLAKNSGGCSCLHFRLMLFKAVEKLKEKGTPLPLPYYWFTDGVMIKPEWIVRITNGIVGWSCDNSVGNCGMRGDSLSPKGDMDECRFYNRK